MRQKKWQLNLLCIFILLTFLLFLINLTSLALIPGDFNADGQVDFEDLMLFALAYGSISGSSNWNAVCDLDPDGKIDFEDLMIFAMHYGEEGYTLTITTYGNGTTEPAEGTYSYTEGTVVHLTATPPPGPCYAFYYWEGEVEDDLSETTTITMDRDQTVQAVFQEFSEVIHNTTAGTTSSTIQSAIDESSPGDTIVVCPGTYYENIELNNRDIILQSADPADPDVVAATIIEGDGIDCVVIFFADDTSTMSGFTIQGGNAYMGGGIAINQSSPTITNNNITGNTASYGGGISMAGSSPTINSNIITGNMVTHDGGGIYGIYFYEGVSPSINGNYIEGNKAITSGGGIFIQTFIPTINNNTITNNTATYGGGLYLSDSSVSVTNNIITYNKANNGGGIFVRYDSYLLPSGDRPIGWGIRESIPILSGDPLEPAEGEEYEIAGNTFLGNGRGDSLEYIWGAHLFYDT